MRIIETDEITGADPADLAVAVRAIIETERPSLRHPVGADAQVRMAQSRASLPPDTLERLIAAHFEGEG